MADTPFAPVLVLLSGITGSGKTTLASRLRQAGMLRVSVDELVFEAHGVYGVDYAEPEYPSFYRPAVEEAERQITGGLEHGRDVVFDHGLWNPGERSQMTGLALDAAGIPVHVTFPVERSEIEERLHARNSQEGANALFVSDDALDDFYARYEPLDVKDAAVDGTEPYSSVVEGIRSAARRSRRVDDPCVDLVLDQILRVMHDVGVQVKNADDEWADAMDLSSAGELAEQIEGMFGVSVLTEDVRAAATVADLARTVRSRSGECMRSRVGGAPDGMAKPLGA